MRRQDNQQLDRAIEKAVRTNDFRDLKEIVREKLCDSGQELESIAQYDQASTEQLRQLLAEIMQSWGRVPVALREQMIEEMVNEIVGYGPIQPFMLDDRITEIMVNGHEQVWIEVDGTLQLTEVKFRDDRAVRQVIEKIVGPLGRRIDESSPTVDARLPDGSRLNAIIHPCSIDGSCITIRKFRDMLGTDQLIELGSITGRELEFLDGCVRGGLNMLVSGGTGSGKTTLLNCLSSFIPSDERIITIEDAAELKLQKDHVVRLEAKPPNVEGKGEITIRQLVINSLRMRPNRIIVGEVRGGEALDMLQAMNTGHEGSISTIHANSPNDALSRLEMMALMSGEEVPHSVVREMAARAIHLIIQTERWSDGSRKVVAISEVLGVERGKIVTADIYTYDYMGRDSNNRVVGKLRATGHTPKFLPRLAKRGVFLADSLFQEVDDGDSNPGSQLPVHDLSCNRGAHNLAADTSFSGR